MIIRKISSLMTAAAFMALLSGCVAPVVENYTAFQDKRFSSRTKAAEIHEGNVTELMQGGYLLIGYVDFKHNVQACYENYTCDRISDNSLTLDELLVRSARRGADRVQLLYSSLELVPRVLSVCTQYSTTYYTDKDGKLHSIQTCISFATYNGYMESWNKRALLWRHEPELASADANYKAVQKAFAIINSGSQETERPPETVTQDAALPAIQSPTAVGGDATEDVYGAQLAAAMDNENRDYLATQLQSARLEEWQHSHSVDLLMMAFAMRKNSMAHWLIEQPVAWGKENTDGYSAVEYAIAFGEPADLELLVKNQPALATRFNHQTRIYTALSEAASPDMVDYLQSKGFSVDGRIDGFPLLYVAILKGNDALARRLLERHAKIESGNPEYPTALIPAIVKSNSVMVTALLDHGARVNLTDPRGNTPLHYAALYGATDALNMLIDRGAQIDVSNKMKYSPLYIALEGGKWETAEALMKRSPNFKPPSADAFVASMRGMLYESPASTLDAYLKQTSLLNDRSLGDLNKSLLIACAERCSEEKMDVFFANGVNIYYAPDSKTLFLHAYEKKNVGALTAMIKRGFRVREEGRVTPLQRALIAGDETLVKAYRLAAGEKSPVAPSVSVPFPIPE